MGRSSRESDYCFGQRGVSTLEVLLFLIAMVLVIVTLIPPILATRHQAAIQECGFRLAVVEEAKREVFKEMNALILPREHRLAFADDVNLQHIDRIAKITLESPWRFHPEDPCPLGGKVNVGETFLDPPSSSEGIKPAKKTAMTP